MVNNVVLVGRIGRDPEMKYSQTGTEITRFVVAVERRRKGDGGDESTDWFEIVTFGKTASFVAQYLDKGSLVAIEGRLQQDRWESADGQKRSRIEVIANSVQALESRQEAERRRGSRPAGGQQGYQQAPAQQQNYQQQAPAPQQAPDPFGDISDDNDPFGDQ